MMKKIIFNKFREKEEIKFKKYDSVKVANKMVFSTKNEVSGLVNYNNLSKIKSKDKNKEFVNIKLTMINDRDNERNYNLNTRNNYLSSSNKLILPSLETLSPYMHSESNSHNKDKFKNSENILFKMFTTPDASKSTLLSDIFPKFETLNKL